MGAGLVGVAGAGVVVVVTGVGDDGASRTTSALFLAGAVSVEVESRCGLLSSIASGCAFDGDMHGTSLAINSFHPDFLGGDCRDEGMAEGEGCEGAV